MDAGYEAPDSFARAFRQRSGQTPTAFRSSPDWEAWLAVLEPINAARTSTMRHGFSADQVRIVEFTDTPVAVMAHRGDPGGLRATIQDFIAWRKAAGLPRRTSATFTIFHAPSPDVPEHRTVTDLFLPLR